MSDSDEPHDSLREAWIESLLACAARREDHDVRIADAMARIDPPTSSDSSANVFPAANTRRRAVRWGLLGLATTVLLMIYLAWGTNQTRAIAAVKRSRLAAAEPTARRYKMRLTRLTPGGTPQDVDADLFVKGNDRFTLRVPGPLFGTSLWLGNDGEEPWVVAPIGPIRKGRGLVLSHWLRQRGKLDTPYLHVSSLLTQMASGYRLRKVADETLTLTNGATEVCDHIIGEAELNEPSELPKRPDVIELWCDRSGVAMRLEARWSLAEDDFGLRTLAIAFEKNDPAIDDSWFTAEGHAGGNRPVIRVE
ncbi:MAG: hypothetical protein AAFU85_06850 [Planctomycetota bacterium]